MGSPINQIGYHQIEIVKNQIRKKHIPFLEQKMENIANQILADIKRQRKSQKDNNDIKTISEKPEIEQAPKVTGTWLN